MFNLLLYSVTIEQCTILTRLHGLGNGRFHPFQASLALPTFKHQTSSIPRFYIHPSYNVVPSPIIEQYEPPPTHCVRNPPFRLLNQHQFSPTRLWFFLTHL
ncbi:hypothetical protein N431DRAFT_31880 [Stipitochalara longipes BDJ]|nr:hypothetical protein N431DRAFT_31880 [Stipitochalara longipes BDJ]